MNTHATDTDARHESERRLAARLVGLSYLLAIVFSVFAEFYVMGQLAGPDAAQTAQRIARLPSLLRFGTAANIAACVTDGLLLASLYLVLAPVSRLWALVALFWGAIETTVLLIGVSHELVALKLLSGADYLAAIPPSNLQDWARFALWSHGMLYSIALMLAGLRSTLFCWLWWRSRLIPRALAGLGVFASLWLFACTYGTLVAPEFGKLLPVGLYGGPIFLFELVAGFWLLVRGIEPRAGDRTVRTA